MDGRPLFSAEGAEVLDAAAIERFCEDYMGIALTDARLLAFCFHAQAKTRGQLTRPEFEKGVAQLTLELPRWSQALAADLDAIYAYAGAFARTPETDYVEAAVALAYWRLFCPLWQSRGHADATLPPKFFAYLEEEVPADAKITKDVWTVRPLLHSRVCAVGATIL